MQMSMNSCHKVADIELRQHILKTKLVGFEIIQEFKKYMPMKNATRFYIKPRVVQFVLLLISCAALTEQPYIEQ